MKKYLRLLNYENALLVIDFINKNEYGYAYITPGAVAIQEVLEENWNIVEDFIKTLGVSYEIGEVEGYKVNEQIIEHLKKSGVI